MLKPDREIHATRIDFYMSEVAEPGSLVAYDTSGSGVALDHELNQAVLGDTGARPLGILLTDVVDRDPAILGYNFSRGDQTHVGGKVALVTKGWVTTDQITGDPAAGDHAVVGPSGTVAPAAPGAMGATFVGRFWSTKDADGFAKVEVDL